MTRYGTLVLVLVLLIAMIGAPVAAIGPVHGTLFSVNDDETVSEYGAATENEATNAPSHIHDGDLVNATMEDNTSEHSTPGDDGVVGEQLAGVVGVQQAELDGALESRTVGLQIANAATDEARTDVVADQLTRNQARLAELEVRRSDLAAAREREEISAGEYRARMASLAVESGTIERAADQSAVVADELPPELLAARGIDQTTIVTLRTDASQLRGNAAGIAGGIVGDPVGAPLGVVDRAGERPGSGELSSASGGGPFTDRSGASDGPESLDRSA